MPKAQQILKSVMNDMELHVHLNGDEAMSFGSAFIASNSSASFKVRKVYLTQHPKYDIKVNFKPMDAEAADVKKQAAAVAAEGQETEDEPIEYEKETVLYKRSDYLGQKKTIHLAYDVNMLIEATAVWPCGHEEELIRFELADLGKLIDDQNLAEKNTTRPKVSLAFELTRSHLFQLNSAKINYEETTVEEIIVEKKEEKKEKKDEEEGDKAAEETDDAQADEASTDATEEKTEETADAETEVEAEAEPEKEYKQVVTPKTFTCHDIRDTPYNVRLLSDDQKKDAKKRIKELDQRDKDKQMADEAKNSYESMIYALRDWLRDDVNEKYVDETEKNDLL